MWKQSRSLRKRQLNCGRSSGRSLRKSQEEMREYAELCEDILNETARVKAQIAELNILLRTE